MLPKSGRRGREKKARSDSRGAEHDASASKEYRAQSSPTCDQTESWAAEAKGDIEKRRICAHGEATALWRRTANCLNAEAGIDKRKTAAREESADDGDHLIGCKPDQREAGRFHEYGYQRHLGAPASIRKMAEEQACGR